MTMSQCASKCTVSSTGGPCGKACYGCMVVGTLVMLLVNFTDPSWTTKASYQALEGLLLLVFISDIATRMLLSREHYLNDRQNVIELCVACICVVTYAAVILQVSHMKQQHELILLLLNVAQILRIVVSIRTVYTHRTASVSNITLPPMTIGLDDAHITHIAAVTPVSNRQSSQATPIPAATAAPQPQTKRSSFDDKHE